MEERERGGGNLLLFGDLYPTPNPNALEFAKEVSARGFAFVSIILEKSLEILQTSQPPQSDSTIFR